MLKQHSSPLNNIEAEPDAWREHAGFLERSYVDVAKGAKYLLPPAAAFTAAVQMQAGLWETLAASAVFYAGPSVGRAMMRKPFKEDANEAAAFFETGDSSRAKPVRWRDEILEELNPLPSK
jgi:hypothetical protein